MVYALLNNKQIVYVGMSNRISQRLFEHRQTKVFDNYIVIDETGDRVIENLCINELKPFYNERTLNVRCAMINGIK